MKGKCSKSDCPAPISDCLEMNSLQDCSHWVPQDNNKSKDKTVRKKTFKNHSEISWTGELLDVEEIKQISYRNSPIIIGLVGKADAGKSSYLGMLFSLFLNGKKLSNFGFTGTNTILGWEKLAHTMRLKRGNIKFPPPTPSDPDYYSFLHLALRAKCNRLQDVLLTDTSGEVFLQWASNREDENANSARWIHKNSSGFILFVDCEALVKQKNAAKSEVIDIAQQLKYKNNKRPVVIVWSKSDVFNDINKNIRESLSEDLQEMFEICKEIKVTNFSNDDPDELCHKNNFQVIDWLLSNILKTSNIKLKLEAEKTEDFFLNYK